MYDNVIARRSRATTKQSSLKRIALVESYNPFHWRLPRADTRRPRNDIQNAMIKLLNLVSHQNQKCYNRLANTAAIMAMVEISIKDSLRNVGKACSCAQGIDR